MTHLAASNWELFKIEKTPIEWFIERCKFVKIEYKPFEEHSNNEEQENDSTLRENRDEEGERQ